VVTDLITASTAKTSPILGATIRKPDGTVTNVRGKSTIIATGGFQGNSRLVSTHIGPGADDIFIRSNPYSTGDGYALATTAGASLSRGLSTFYGHLLPSPLQARTVSPTHFIHLAQFQSGHAILVNSQGKRFCDETFGDEVNNQHLAKQPGRVGYMILNEAVKQKYAVGAPSLTPAA
jgi:succinate dehydrogenase/fumarate reductase flavoprotein subunit